MDRRLLLVPASALFAHAQSSPEAVEAEKALRERVQQFYDLQKGNKFRQAEEFVAEDSKDDYYNARKQEVKDFQIEKVELAENNTRAKVVIKGRVLMLFAGVQELVVPTESTWKIDNGKWCWYLDPATKNLTPFGLMATGDANGVPEIKGLDMTGKAPDLNEILKQISIDRTLVVFDDKNRSQTVVIKNATSGPLTLALDPHVAAIKGLDAKIDNAQLDSGQSGKVILQWNGLDKIDDVAYVRVDPYLRGFNVRLRTQ
jgi:hypothetical protein